MLQNKLIELLLRCNNHWL